MSEFVSTKFSSQAMFGEVVTEIGLEPIRKSLVSDWVGHKLSLVQWVLDWDQRVVSDLIYCTWPELLPPPTKD